MQAVEATEGLNEVDPEVAETLREIVELGFVRVRPADGAGAPRVDVRAPLVNVATAHHLEATARYLREYAGRRPEFSGEFFLCLYDGWREYGEPERDPARRRYVPWRELAPADRARFIGRGSVGEPRFIHGHPDTSLYPVLCRPVLAYCRHVGDTSVRLIPDAEFLKDEFRPFAAQVRAGAVPFEKTAPKMFWRGSANVNAGYAYLAAGLAVPRVHPRRLLVALSESPAEVAPGLRVADFCDASFARATVAEMLRHRYQLDVDGMVSAWSGLYWKLLSPALVVKAPTHWEQWYYRDLVPGQHFVPLADFGDLKKVYLWCAAHDDECAAIAARATAFAESLTMDYALDRYTIA